MQEAVHNLINNISTLTYHKNLGVDTKKPLYLMVNMGLHCTCVVSGSFQHGHTK